MTYIKAAHQRLIGTLQTIWPTEISAFPKAEEFEARATLMQLYAEAFDEFLYSLAVDAKENMPVINTKDFLGVVSKAIADAGLPQWFDEEADAIRKDKEEFNADRAGWAKAHELGVD